MSKRTSGTFRDYLKLRTIDNSIQFSRISKSLSTTNKNINNYYNDNSNKILNQMINMKDENDEEKENTHMLQNNNNISNSKGSSYYSDYINYKHGLNKLIATTDVTNNDTHHTQCNIPNNNNMDDDKLYSNTNNQLNDLQLSHDKDDNSIITGDNRQINSDITKYTNNYNDFNDYDNVVFYSSNNSFLKKYNFEDTKNQKLHESKIQQQFEAISTDDCWYASASDIDDSDGGLSKSVCYTGTPVLECVNQVNLLILYSTNFCLYI